MTTRRRRGADRLSAWVAAYDAQGWHRSGSRTDGRSGRWLAGVASSEGASVRLESHAFDRVVHRRSVLQIDGRVLPGTPLYDATFPPAAGVRGVLGAAGSGADIGVVETAPGLRLGDLLDTVRRTGRHRAIVAVTRGGAPGPALRNAPADEPYGPPVLQVSSRYADTVARAAAAGAVATLEVDARRLPAHLVNVVADMPGHRTGPPAVVVLTPRSGWWQCAAERGGGLACWLGTLHEIRDRTDRPVRFLATSGHELGHLGLRSHLADQAPGPGSTWVHLGANIGARGGVLGVAGSDGALVERAIGALEDEGMPSAWLRRLPIPVGEASELQRLGARVVSLVGTNDHFHLPSDRYPSNLDPERLHAACSGIVALVASLAEQR